MIKSDRLPMLPLRDVVVFPSMIAPLFVGRDKSIKALNEVMKTDKKIILVTQKNAEVDDPLQEDIYSFGCESKVLQLLKLPDGTVKVLVEGINRVKILECKDNKEFLTSSVEVIKDKVDSKEDLLAFSIAIARKLEKLTSLNKKVSFELMTSIKDLKDPSKISDHISSQLNISIADKQILLVGELEKLPLNVGNNSVTEEIPDEFKGVYNVRLTKEFIINPTNIDPRIKVATK